MSMPDSGWRRIVAATGLACAFGLGSAAGRAAPEGPRLGQPLSAADISAAAINVFPDGTGLPIGSGTAAAGKPIYQAHCQSCHGVEGSGGSGGELVGRSPLNGPHPDQTVGNYWPYATTIFDFIRRSMPLDAPRSLRDEEVYALTAYLLYLNGIIDEHTVMDAKSLPAVPMPNRNGFVRVWPETRNTGSVTSGGR